MAFIRNLWYVAAWTSELEQGKVIGRTIIGDPVALFRKTDGSPVAIVDRCSHRHAALSLGRVEGDEIRCMYHGLKFSADGKCTHIPGTDKFPPNTDVHVYPVIERDGWLWVWMGDPDRADPALITSAWGLENPSYELRTGALDYDAHYELINDNLCDLSHLDYTHETTLGAATGIRWSDDQPKITTLEHGLFFDRWFIDRAIRPGHPERCDARNIYHYMLPGLFIMTTDFYPLGTAEACAGGEPNCEPFLRRVEQQAVTPISENRTRYLFGTGIDRDAPPDFLEGVFKIVNSAFAEDRLMIETQQKIWDLTPPDVPKAFIPQDKAPAILRRLIAKRLAEEVQIS